MLGSATSGDGAWLERHRCPGGQQQGKLGLPHLRRHCRRRCYPSPRRLAPALRSGRHLHIEPHLPQPVAIPIPTLKSGRLPHAPPTSFSRLLPPFTSAREQQRGWGEGRGYWREGERRKEMTGGPYNLLLLLLLLTMAIDATCASSWSKSPKTVLEG